MGDRDFSSFSDEDISTFVDATYLNGANINLGVPFQRETVAFFMKIFSCRQCGVCCRGGSVAETSGVILEPEEVEKLAESMAVPRSRFKKDLTYVKEGHRILRYPCPFRDEGSRSCRIYAMRPGVCRNFPIHAPLASGGIYLLVVAGICPEGRRVAVEFLKMRRDIEISLQKLQPGEREKIAGISRKFWDSSEMEQQQSGLLKKIN